MFFRRVKSRVLFFPTRSEILYFAPHNMLLSAVSSLLWITDFSGLCTSLMERSSGLQHRDR